MKNINHLELLQRIACEYEDRTPSGDARVPEAYRALALECKRQYETIPVRVHFVTVDLYKGSRQLFAAIDLGSFNVYTGGNAHPLWSRLENAIFRAVHDYYGHWFNQASFALEGEIKAWRAHREMFSEKARKAYDTETLGAVATYFLGSKPGEYPEQKAFILETDYTELIKEETDK